MHCAVHCGLRTLFTNLINIFFNCIFLRCFCAKIFVLKCLKHLLYKFEILFKNSSITVHLPQVFLQRFPCQFRLATSHLGNTQKDIVFLPCKKMHWVYCCPNLGQQYTRFRMVWHMRGLGYAMIGICVVWDMWGLPPCHPVFHYLSCGSDPLLPCPSQVPHSDGTVLCPVQNMEIWISWKIPHSKGVILCPVQNMGIWISWKIDVATHLSFTLSCTNIATGETSQAITS